MTESAVLSVRGLAIESMISGQAVIQNVDFELKSSEIVCLHGPSGSGKSSLASALMGLLPEGLLVSGGAAILMEQNLLALDSRAFAKVRGKGIAMIFQDPLSSLNPVLPCGIQAETPLTLHTTLTPQARRAAVLESFGQMGFDDPERIYSAFPAELSGGQRQRVMLAMASLLKPAVLIADEPTSALDSVSANLILDLMAQLSSQDGVSVLLITHDVDITRRVATRYLRMQDGTLKEDPRSQQVKPTPVRHRSSRPQEGARLTVKSLSKTHRDDSASPNSNAAGVVVLRDVSLEILPGEIIGIVGPSGSGKTTLGRCIAGLEKPDQGEILLQGHPLQVSRTCGKPHPVQIVYQSPYSSLNPSMSIADAISEGLRWSLPDRAKRLERAKDLLANVGLPANYLSRLPSELSGGERQRVVIARCLAAEPLLLVADEPTASLDDDIRDQILSLFERLRQKQGISTLLISHDPEAIAKVCSRSLRLEHGSVVELND